MRPAFEDVVHRYLLVFSGWVALTVDAVHQPLWQATKHSIDINELMNTQKADIDHLNAPRLLTFSRDRASCGLVDGFGRVVREPLQRFSLLPQHYLSLYLLVKQ